MEGGVGEGYVLLEEDRQGMVGYYCTSKNKLNIE